MTSIGSSTFYQCYYLTSVVIGKSVSYIGNKAFYQCSSLKKIICYAQTPPDCYTNRSTPFDGVKVHECTLMVPEESIDTYKDKTTYVWSAFDNIVPLEPCAAPSIILQDGKIVVTTATEGAICKTSITSEDFQSTEASEIVLSGVYTITAYASKEDFSNSDTATATLVWVNPSMEDTGIISMEMKKAVLLHSADNAIIVEGLDEGESLELYSTNGMMLDKITSTGTSAALGHDLQKMQIYIIKAGDRSIKYQF